MSRKQLTAGALIQVVSLCVTFGLTAFAVLDDEWTQAIFWFLVHAWTAEQAMRDLDRRPTP